MRCPRCRRPICNCLMEDPAYLLRAVGKRLSQLESGKRQGLSTTKSGDSVNGDETAGTRDDCFATPPWLVEALRRDYGDFGLDAAASHGYAVAERYYKAGLINNKDNLMNAKEFWAELKKRVGDLLPDMFLGTAHVDRKSVV